MKALSIKQPWAHLIVHGAGGNIKTIETRLWRTDHRGDLLIVSSKRPDAHMMAACRLQAYESFSSVSWGCTENDMEFGKAIGVAHLVDCREMREGDEAAALCPVYPGAWAWVFDDVKAIDPFPVRGQLRLYDVDTKGIAL